MDWNSIIVIGRVELAGIYRLMISGFTVSILKKRRSEKDLSGFIVFKLVATAIFTFLSHFKYSKSN